MEQKNDDVIPQTKDVIHAPDTRMVSYSGPIKLNDKVMGLQGATLHVVSLPMDTEKEGITGIYLTEDTKERQTYVGHIVFSQESDAEASVSINHCKRKDFIEKSEEIPPHIASLIKDNGSVFHAVEINPAYRDKHVGGLFWVSALKLMGDKGMTSAVVTGDITIGRKKPTDSFYMKYGAEIDNQGREIVPIAKVVAQNSELISKMFQT